MNEMNECGNDFHVVMHDLKISKLDRFRLHFLKNRDFDFSIQDVTEKYWMSHPVFVSHV